MSKSAARKPSPKSPDQKAIARTMKRAGDMIWVISLREADKKEKRDYEKAIDAGW